MRAAFSTTTQDLPLKIGLLVAVLLFSWLTSAKHLVSDWVRTAQEEPAHVPPNILLIVADDLGYNDTNVFNPTGLETPNIFELSKGGATFTRHYADATCTPSRVGLLTGRYPERSGFRPIGQEIPAEFPTLAESLQNIGYRTYLTGKWHAGEARAAAWPQNKGFDHWFGFLNQFELSPLPTKTKKQKRRPTYRNPLLRIDGGEQRRYEGHLTEILTRHTIEKIEKFQSQDEPWFLYHAFLAPHTPIQPAARFKEKFPDTPQGEYEALVAQLDESIGRILDAVDKERTLVIFLSDNGGTNLQRDNNFPFFGRKSEPYEGAYRTPLILHWPTQISSGEKFDDVVMNVDIFPTVLAATGAPSDTAIDGINLWPLLRGAHPTTRRERGWEVYAANVDLLSFSYLSADSAWRLVGADGLGASLYDLGSNPSGREDVVERHRDKEANFTERFWKNQWEKSVIPVKEVVSEDGLQTTYSGFDAMRTPHQYGFAIGLEIGPLPNFTQNPTSQHDQDPLLLAGQEGSWALFYREGRGIEWHFGDTVLRDAQFEPSACNAVVLTGYLEAEGHLALRKPRSTLKLYSSGFLRDLTPEQQFHPDPSLTSLATATVIQHAGKALFSNQMLSTFDDPYTPLVEPQYIEYFLKGHKERYLSIANVEMMDAQLCQGPARSL